MLCFRARGEKRSSSDVHDPEAREDALAALATTAGEGTARTPPHSRGHAHLARSRLQPPQRRRRQLRLGFWQAAPPLLLELRRV